MRLTWLRRCLVHLVVTAVVAVLLMELGLRVYICHFASDSEFIRLAGLAQFERHGTEHCILLKHPYLRYVLNPGFRTSDGRTHINRHGCRGREFSVPKPSGEYRIACIGGSTTYDDEIPDDDQTYPARLEAHLRERGFDCVVVNAGVPGWTSYESLINYELRLSYAKPDLLIIFDAWNDLSLRFVSPPAYASDNTGAKRFPSVTQPWYERSSCLRAALIVTGCIQPPVFRLFFGTPDTVVQFPRDPYFQTKTLKDMRESNPPTFFACNLRNLVRLARANGTEALLMTFPCIVAEVDPEQCRDQERYDNEVAALNKMNEVVKRVGAENDIPVFDLAEAFPKTDDPHTYYVDGIHNNELGADLKAKMIADYLVENHILPVKEAKTP